LRQIYLGCLVSIGPRTLKSRSFPKSRVENDSSPVLIDFNPGESKPAAMFYEANNALEGNFLDKSGSRIHIAHTVHGCGSEAIPRDASSYHTIPTTS